jgi:hypothetical protein
MAPNTTRETSRGPGGSLRRRLLGWALPLAAAQFRYGVGPAATSLAALMGFSHQAAIPVIFTYVVGLLVGLTGAWLGSAGRSSLSPSGRGLG